MKAKRIYNSAYHQWGEEYFNPIVRALFVRERAQAESELDNAVKSLKFSDMEDDDKQSAAMRLEYYRFQILYLLGSDAEARKGFDGLENLLTTPQATRLAEIERNRFLFLIENIADIEGWAELGQPRVQILLDQIPEDEYDGELWYNVAGWAFRHRFKPLVDQAFEEMTIRRKGSISDMTWKRINLMYLLLERRADRNDVKEYVKDISVASAFDEFWKHIWPMVRENGLVTDELEAYITARERELAESGPQVPKQTPSVVRIRKDL